MPNIDKEELFIQMIKEQLNIQVSIKKKPKRQIVIPTDVDIETRRKIERLFELNFKQVDI
jgi:hypothetical protein